MKNYFVKGTQYVFIINNRCVSLSKYSIYSYNGLYNGKGITYFEYNNVKNIETEHKNDLLNGKMIIYKANGCKDYEIIMQNDKAISGKSFIYR